MPLNSPPSTDSGRSGAKPLSSPATEEAKPGFWRSQRENVQIVVIALGLALLLRIFVAEPRFIPSDSMVPTLQVGDRLVVEKVSYRLHTPEQGDIIVFEPPAVLQEFGYGKDQAFIKRIIGLPGQTVEVRDRQVFVNQKPLTEPYIVAAPSYTMPSVTVPAESYFVMGDNRNNSNDSHVWGFLPRRNIIGRAVFRFFPLDQFGAVLPTRDVATSAPTASSSTALETEEVQ